MLKEVLLVQVKKKIVYPTTHLLQIVFVFFFFSLFFLCATCVKHTATISSFKEKEIKKKL